MPHGCALIEFLRRRQKTTSLSFVRPGKDKAKASIALIIPTFSYMAYANDNLCVNSVIAEVLIGRIPLLQASDLLLNKERVTASGPMPAIATVGA